MNSLPGYRVLGNAAVGKDFDSCSVGTGKRVQKFPVRIIEIQAEAIIVKISLKLVRNGRKQRVPVYMPLDETRKTLNDQK